MQKNFIVLRKVTTNFINMNLFCHFKPKFKDLIIKLKNLSVNFKGENSA